MEPTPETSPRNSAEIKRQRFRANLRWLMQWRGISFSELVRRTGIERHVIARWMKSGAEKPRSEYLTRMASVLGLEDPRLIFEVDLHERQDDLLPQPRTIDRSTNPLIEQVVTEQPQLFASFSEDDWDEIYSLHGTGGPLTAEGVIGSADHINAKRDLRQKFEAVMETDYFPTLQSIIELMYRDTEVPL